MPMGWIIIGDLMACRNRRNIERCASPRFLQRGSNDQFHTLKRAG